MAGVLMPRARPENANVNSESDLTWLGYELLKQDAHEDALLVFRTLTADYPKSANAFDSLGDGLAQAGKVQEAIPAFERALQLNPDAPDTNAKLEDLRTNGRIFPYY